MSILKVTREELENAKLSYLLVEREKYSYEIISETYYWDTREIPATICLLAGIGEILANPQIDTATD